jgi:hypothetical protein
MRTVATFIIFVVSALMISVLPLRAEEIIKGQQNPTVNKAQIEQKNKGRVACKMNTATDWPDLIKPVSRTCVITGSK